MADAVTSQTIIDGPKTAVLKFNYEVDKTEKMLIRDFEDKYLNEYEKTLQ